MYQTQNYTAAPLSPATPKSGFPTLQHDGGGGGS